MKKKSTASGQNPREFLTFLFEVLSILSSISQAAGSLNTETGNATKYDLPLPVSVDNFKGKTFVMDSQIRPL